MKWSEKQATKRMDQAIEMKKQQERFIDMTSHEMRNPLSALIGCADEIISALRECCRMAQDSQKSVTDATSKDLKMEMDLLTDSLENADTIIYCALHQKRSKFTSPRALLSCTTVLNFPAPAAVHFGHKPAVSRSSFLVLLW
jgi:signal transduction histidine kinase